MTKFEHKIDSSTNLISFIYQGTYETHLGRLLWGVPREDKDAYQNEVGTMYVNEILACAIESILPSDIDDEFNLTYERTTHPRYYNFETDAIEFTFEFSDAVKDYFDGYAKNNKAVFDGFLHDNFTSRSGFYSFVPNNFSEWYDGFVDDDNRCVSVLVSFMLNCYVMNDNYIPNSDWEEYMYDFAEKCEDIARDSYFPSEYTVRYNNGFVGHCECDYDEDRDVIIYHGSLFDADGNLVKSYTADDWSDENMGSAFSAWENRVEDEVTDNHAHVGYEYEQMDSGTFHEMFDGKF